MLAFYKTSARQEDHRCRAEGLDEAFNKRAQAWVDKFADEVIAKMRAEMKKRATTILSRSPAAGQTRQGMTEEVDLFVIGAGSGGVRAARIASGYGARVMIAEEYRVGGTCVIRGCVPKKLLVYASRFADEFEDAAGFGWTVPEPTFDWATLIANKDKEIDRLEKAYTANLDRAKVEIVKSRAVLVDPHTVKLTATGETVRAKHILIATGGWPSLGKDIEGREHVISSNEAFHLKELPKRILIQGGGYIAVEFAGIFNGLGSEVTLVYRGDNILRGFDEDVRNHLRTEMEKRGIKISPSRSSKASRRSITASTSSCPITSSIVVDKVMFATGRRPNVKGLGLEAAGVELDETRRDRGQRIFADQRAAHLCGRRRHRPDCAHAGRDPRGPRLRRHACSATSRRRSITPTCRPRCSPSPRSA